MKIGTWNISSGINVNNCNNELFDISPSIKVDGVLEPKFLKLQLAKF